jgi:lipoprotein-anchoring transpeptidase ErfK/SrfK
MVDSKQELHGTSAERLIGRNVSNGCVRHPNAAIAKMFSQVRAGDRVAIVASLLDPRLHP